MTEQNCKPGELSLNELLAFSAEELDDFSKREDYKHVFDKIDLAIQIKIFKKEQLVLINMLSDILPMLESLTIEELESIKAQFCIFLSLINKIDEIIRRKQKELSTNKNKSNNYIGREQYKGNSYEIKS
ncbi:MAG: hypothetical protein EKK57_02260 [Proteobacteria bacterium]|nr:MAG: hypothetical protein EKK57_02260 [Pseudomonadota bacterium]